LYLPIQYRRSLDFVTEPCWYRFRMHCFLSFNASRLRCPFPNRRESYRRCFVVSTVREWIEELLSFVPKPNAGAWLRRLHRRSLACILAFSSNVGLRPPLLRLVRDQAQSSEFFASGSFMGVFADPRQFSPSISRNTAFWNF